MIDKVVKSADVGSVDLPFPGYTGDIKIKPLNGDYALGPSMIHIRMEPGAFIPAHLHKKAAEVLCILDGDFINENKAYGSGSPHDKKGLFTSSLVYSEHGRGRSERLLSC